MAHFAKIENNIVTDIIVADQDVLDSGIFGDAMFVQTSYNNNIKGMYAGIGYTYDKDLDMFIPPQPHPSWILSNGVWEAPVKKPIDDKLYLWNEVLKIWEETTSILPEINNGK